MSRWLAAMLAVATIGGCAPLGGGSDAGPTDAGPALVALGTGETSFTPIAEGQTLELARGCQGLQHVWTALRAEGLDPRGVRVTLMLARVGDGTVVSAPFDVRLTFDGADAGDATLSGLMLVVPTPDAAIGPELVMTGTLVDRAGRTASASVHVHVVWGTQVCG
jgi:hypothetical protein